VIDVTRKSIEESSATIIKLLNDRRSGVTEPSDGGET